MGWWPYRAVLLPATNSFSTDDHEYGLMAWSDQGGGTRGNPRAQNAFLYLLRYPKDLKFEMGSYFKMLSEGALSLQLVSQENVAGAGASPQPDGFVEIRGRRAPYNEARKPSSNVDTRRISWIEPQASGRQVTVIVWSDPTVYTLQEVVAWVDSLTEA